MSTEISKEEIIEKIKELSPHPLDDEYTKTVDGGCWICRRGNAWEETDKFEFNQKHEVFYHPECLDKLGVESMDELQELVGDRYVWT